MATIDYGAIAFKNGKLISTDMFTPMLDMVDWEDTKEDTYHDYQKDKDVPLNLKNNYFAYIGDKNLTIAFYKEQIVIIRRFKDNSLNYKHVYFNDTNFIWSRWERIIWIKKEPVKIKVTKRNGYLVCKCKYKGNKYKVYFGYGVDLPLYKKFKLVNYYRSPIYKFKKLKYWCKEKSRKK